MTPEPGSAREAVERNAAALAAGNLAQILMDITPEALAQVMQMATQQGVNPAGLSLTALPSVSSYEVAEAGKDADSETFHVTFTSDKGTATLSSTWKQVLGQWKIVSLGVVSLEPAAGAPE